LKPTQELEHGKNVLLDPETGTETMTKHLKKTG
jgi:hypothetical protein